MSAAARTGTARGRATGRPRLYTVPPDAPFLETLARAILDGDLPAAGGTPPAPLDLTRWTVLLPTRRAVRALSEAFLRVSGDQALLLPRIRPLGDVDEDALALSAPPFMSSDAGLALSLLPAIGTMERRLALIRLILKWSALVAAGANKGEERTAATPAQALSLAAQLGALMDSLDTEQVDLERLQDLVPERFADHWQKTLEFLRIVTEHWPRHLEEQGVMAPYARRDALMAAETDRLLSDPAEAPVIAAGSTGTVPATAALLEAVARLGNGAVVLPGLDLDLDEESWQTIAGPEPHPEHPQFGMSQFLSGLGVSRPDVQILGGGGSEHGRSLLVSETMRPARTTERWLAFAESADRDAVAAALEGVERIDAPSEQDEAEVISLLMRHAVEQPGRVAALVTPDRTLARRVSARLEKWNLAVDDSAGTPLDKSQRGSFMDAVAEAAGSGCAPVPLLALLKHPLTRLGRSAADMRRAARLLELVALRQPATAPGLAALRRSVKRTQKRLQERALREPAIARLTKTDWTAIDRLIRDLEGALGTFMKTFESADTPRPLAEFVRAHLLAGEALAVDKGGSGAALWRGEAGEALADLFESLLTADEVGPEIAPSDYPEFCRSLLSGVPVRPRMLAHPRLHIWGPLEARLQRPDIVILGGLNEGVWPATVETDPWLSRPMRMEVGLSAPERHVGLAAHDVAQLMGVPQVYLTRAEKVAGAPTVASRWLLRLDAVLDALDLGDALKPKAPWLAWARARDAADAVEPVSVPAPCPPVAARPKRLSVTRVEAWIANPYSVFAHDILKLTRLNDLAVEPDAALKGSLVHDMLMRFSRQYPDRLPDDSAAALMDVANELFDEFGDQARVAAFWRRQFGRFARWFAATEPSRREAISQVAAEVSGELTLAGAGGFILSAKADRIDMREDGTLTIYDYKTGEPPRPAQVEEGKAPQLPLEAVIAQGGGFEGVPAAPVSRLAYIRARGYGEGGEERDASARVAPETLARDALAHLERLVAAYAKKTQAYKALRRRGFDYRYDDYAHLARVQEWQAAGAGD